MPVEICALLGRKDCYFVSMVASTCVAIDFSYDEKIKINYSEPSRWKRPAIGE
jgi:hypothetical protein